jgi:hypothetical protein
MITPAIMNMPIAAVGQSTFGRRGFLDSSAGQMAQATTHAACHILFVTHEPPSAFRSRVTYDASCHSSS